LIKTYLLTIKTLLLLTLLVIAKKDVFASHLVGGTMTYQCLGNNNYEITLTLYRDCNGSGAEFDFEASIGVFNNGALISNEFSPFTTKTPVPIILNNPCLISPPNVCIEKTEYKQLINLPPIAGGYDIVYQRCCRNSAAMNIESANDAGSSYAVKIPEQAACNNSPTFNNPPPTAMCAGYEFTYDLSATDSDGDSLFYTFKDAVTGGTSAAPAPSPPSPPPFNPILWGAGYSTNYQIDANPAFTINPNTGALIGTPTTFGAYTFNVTVKEYRNGIFINEIYRDLLVYVNNCEINTVAEFSDSSAQIGQTNFCTGTSVNITNTSINSTSYFWDFGDLATNADTSRLETPTYAYPDTGVYNITLIANPGYFCADTVVHQFLIQPTLNPSFTTPTAQCLEGNLFELTAIANTNPDDTISWSFGNAGVPLTGEGTTTQTSYSAIGTYPIELTIKNYGCETSYIDSAKIIANPTASFSPQSVFCDGLTVNLDNNSTNNSSSFWSFGDQNNSTEPTPNHTYADSGSYNIMLIANQLDLCFDTTFQTYSFYPQLTAFFAPQASQCLINNSFLLTAEGNFNTKAIFNWDFNGQGNATSSNTIQTSVNFDSPNTFLATLSIENYGCTATYQDSLRVDIEPSANFTPSNSGCQPLDASFTNHSISTTPLTYFWDFGNGSTSTAEHPNTTYFEAGIFSTSLIVSTSSGCIASDTLLLPNAITVEPQPKIKYILNPLETYFLNHEIIAEDRSSQLLHQFDFGDGNSYTDSIVTHIYDEPGNYVFNYLVTSAYGCTNFEQQNIWVKPDFLFFAPNSFTPDGDGLNDSFFIHISGIKAYEIKVYNRWGELIFKSNDATTGWDGKHKGNDVPAGVYTWKIELKTIDSLQHKRLGKINLMR
jgi:gliding motility-associated-like protein